VIFDPAADVICEFPSFGTNADGRLGALYRAPRGSETGGVKKKIWYTCVLVIMRIGSCSSRLAFGLSPEKVIIC